MTKNIIFLLFIGVSCVAFVINGKSISDKELNSEFNSIDYIEGNTVELKPVAEPGDEQLRVTRTAIRAPEFCPRGQLRIDGKCRIVITNDIFGKNAEKTIKKKNE